MPGQKPSHHSGRAKEALKSSALAKHKNIQDFERKPRLLRCSRGFLKFVFMQILRISPFSIVLLANKTKEISHETESFIHDFSGLPAPD
jgi:hypothetical protein